MSYVLTHLVALVALAATFSLAGYALARLLFRGDEPRAFRPLARLVLGLAVFMLALFALAAVGALGTPGVLAVCIAAVGAAVIARVRFGPAPAGAVNGEVFVAACALATAPLFLLALSQGVSWDANTYHLTLPRLYLEAGGFVTVPMSVYANWPLGTQLLFAAAMALQDHALAKSLHAAFGLATLWAVWLGAAHFHRPRSGWLAAPLVLASPVVLFEWSVAYVDLAYAFFLVAGVLFAAHWRATGAREALWLAGFCGGALASVKVSGPLGAIAIGSVLLPALWQRGRDGAADLVRFAAPVVMLGLPWLVRAALETGNPVYPWLHGTFGGPDWSPALAEQFARWQREIGMGRAPLDYLKLPWRVINEGGARYDRFGGVVGVHWVAVLPLAIAGLRNRLVRAALMASGVYFVLWALGSQQARFLIPILPLLALAGSVGAFEALARLSKERERRVTVVLFVVAAVWLAVAAREPVRQAWALWPAFSAGGDALPARPHGTRCTASWRRSRTTRSSCW